jgi:hypothetical protein
MPFHLPVSGWALFARFVARLLGRPLAWPLPSGPDNARRSAPAAGHRGRRARQLGTPGGLPPKGRDESCRTAYGELPGPDPCRLRRASLAAHLPHGWPRPLLVPHVQAVRPGAPWRAPEAVEKVVAGSDGARMPGFT